MFFYVFVPTNLTKVKKKNRVWVRLIEQIRWEKKIRFLKIKSYFLNFRFTLSPHQALPLFHAYGPMAMATCFDQVNRESYAFLFSLFLSFAFLPHILTFLSLPVRKRVVNFLGSFMEEGQHCIVGLIGMIDFSVSLFLFTFHY